MDEPNDKNAPSGGRLSREEALRIALGGVEAMREAIRKGQALPPRPESENPDWELHERRLDEIEEVIRTGTGPEAADRFDALHETFMLDFQADMARAAAGVEARLVRFFDDLEARVEERKFELPSDARDELEDVRLPYREQFREEMLGRLPIEKRRQLETDRERGVTPPSDQSSIAIPRLPREHCL